jgi:hypothetical protein
MAEGEISRLRQLLARIHTEKGKSKKTAIALAVLLAPLNWLYTYKKDALKFWIALVLDIFLSWTIVVPICIVIWAVADASIKDDTWYRNY